MPGWGFTCSCWGFGRNCLCCCCCEGCRCSWRGMGCGSGAGFWLGPWAVILSSSSFFLMPACICLRISFLFRISSRRRFCSSIFIRYCLVSSSSSGSCWTAFGISFLTTVRSIAPGSAAALATAWPRPLPPVGTGRTFCPGRTPCAALATGLKMEAGAELGWTLFMFVLPGAMGSSRRLLLRWGRICICCLDTGGLMRGLLEGLRCGAFRGICRGLPCICC